MNNRIATVITTVRPVKKLFVLEENQLQEFVNSIATVSKEIGGISNLFLLNNEQLLQPNTITFVKEHSPDVIINHSQLPNRKLSENFHLPAFSSSDHSVTRFSTSLDMFHNPSARMMPNLFERPEASEVFCTFATTLSLTNILFALHFGVGDQDLIDRLRESDFKDVQVSSITTDEQFLDLHPKAENALLFLSTGLYSVGHGSSIWSNDYNPDRWFDQKNTIIFGESDDLRSMVYFWNMRATFLGNGIVWLPIEYYLRNKIQLTQYDYYVHPSGSEILNAHVRESASTLTEIDGRKYYFPILHERWPSFQHLQNVSVVENRFRILHPLEKTFSTLGFNVPVMLDIRGIEEFFVPDNIRAAELFVELPDRQSFKEYFVRLSNRGLSISIHRFSPIDNDPLIEQITIPPTEGIFAALFEEKDLQLTATPATKITKQVIDLVGGPQELDVLSDKLVFDLLVALTPRRIERIIKALTPLPTKDMTEETIRRLIQETIGDVEIINSDLNVTMNQLVSLSHVSTQDKGKLFERIQGLYDRKILMRGKSFRCRHCHSLLWFPLETIKDDNKCYGCNQFVHIPIFKGLEEEGDHFRLNDLLINAVDQGVMPLLVTLNLLSKQKFYSKRFIYNYEFISHGTHQKMGEVDLIFTIGGRVGLGEVKADRGFNVNQTDRLLALAERVSADILLFSTLRKKDSQEVQELIELLRLKKLSIPVLILTNEVLFSEVTVRLAKYFEQENGLRTLPMGPILVD